MALSQPSLCSYGGLAYDTAKRPNVTGVLNTLVTLTIRSPLWLDSLGRKSQKALELLDYSVFGLIFFHKALQQLWPKAVSLVPGETQVVVYFPKILEQE